ncbi:MAG: hypothetical protein KTR14_00195 [Vampirovibrio sp.]|nr:hypothetical protein [Vampirovibrio sp.]
MGGSIDSCKSFAQSGGDLIKKLKNPKTIPDRPLNEVYADWTVNAQTVLGTSIERKKVTREQSIGLTDEEIRSSNSIQDVIDVTNRFLSGEWNDSTGVDCIGNGWGIDDNGNVIDNLPVWKGRRSEGA